MSLRPLTHWRTTDDTDETGVAAEPEAVEPAEAEDAWTAQVAPVLSEVAGRYQQLITHTDLAARLQDATGLFTRTSPNSWMDRVLAAAAALDVTEDRPPLTALVVHKTHGTVGEAYVEVLKLRNQAPIADPIKREKHAAEARMECYRWAEAKMPDDGGHPALSPKFDMIVTRDRKKARAEAMPDVCPNCFMAIPPTGICDSCA
ncbi:MAG: hypothetical protein LH468_10510 [Nocardioides sp.]|nr:hypothetical protein [Nocardioides sp.]